MTARALSFLEGYFLLIEALDLLEQLAFVILSVSILGTCRHSAKPKEPCERMERRKLAITACLCAFPTTATQSKNHCLHLTNHRVQAQITLSPNHPDSPTEHPVCSEIARWSWPLWGLGSVPLLEAPRHHLLAADCPRFVFLGSLINEFHRTMLSLVMQP